LLFFAEDTVIDAEGVAQTEARPLAATWLFATSVFIPAIMDTLIRGEEPEDDDYERDDWWLWALAKTGSFMIAPVPGARELYDTAILNDPFASEAPHARLYTIPAAIINNTIDGFATDEEFDTERITRDLMTLTTLGRVAPLAQAEIWVDNFWESAELESPRDLIWRRPRN